MYEEVEEYYNRRYKELIKLAYSRTRCLTGAEDIVQDSFLNSIQYYKSFKPEIAKFDQWFMGIFQRCIKKYQREERLGGMSVELKEEMLFTGDSVVEDSKVLQEIKNLISTEPNLINRQVCYLHFIEQYNPREILQVVDTTHGNIRTYLWAFRKTLKGIYGEY